MLFQMFHVYMKVRKKVSPLPIFLGPHLFSLCHRVHGDAVPPPRSHEVTVAGVLLARVKTQDPLKAELAMRNLDLLTWCVIKHASVILRHPGDPEIAVIAGEKHQVATDPNTGATVPTLPTIRVMDIQTYVVFQLLDSS